MSRSMATDGEKISLLKLQNTEENADEEIGSSDSGEVIGQLDAFYVMFGFSLGTGVLIISYSVRQLGIIGWLFGFTAVILLQYMATYCLNVTTKMMSDEHSDGRDSIRDPYQSTAELAGGKILRKCSMFVMYLSNGISCISLLLVAASTMATFVHISPLSKENDVRVWVTILVAVLTPIMYLGTYKELKLPAIVALSTALVSAAGVIVNCILKLYVYPYMATTSNNETAFVQQNIFIPIGSLIFMTSGASITVSNLTAIAREPKKLGKSISASMVCMYVVYIIVGLVPFYVFDADLSPSILDTMNDIIKRTDKVTVFQVIAMVIQALMLIHLSMAALLAMNPIYLHLEETLNIPHDLNWKRVGIRTVCMLIVLAICLLIPQFEFAVGLCGGVPLTIMGILLPLFIYTRLCEMHIIKKLAIYAIMLVVTVFVVGNLVASIWSLVVQDEPRNT